MTTVKKIIRAITPPVLFTAAKSLTKRLAPVTPEWEYLPDGWNMAQVKTGTSGWNNERIVQIYREKWPDFLRSLEGTKPLGVNHEAAAVDSGSIKDHNIMMTFGYVLARAAQEKKGISFLDWGGGVGHYYVIAKKLMPELAIQYTSKDLPLMCKHGREFVPEATFDSTEACLEQTYDLIVASASLYYAQDWQTVVKKLAAATKGYLFITRQPMVQKTNSFVTVQRVYRYGYDTEYLGWCLNEAELVEVARQAGLQLILQFVTGEQVKIHNAPEPCQMRGYLFKPVNQNEK